MLCPRADVLCRSALLQGSLPMVLGLQSPTSSSVTSVNLRIFKYADRPGTSLIPINWPPNRHGDGSQADQGRGFRIAGGRALNPDNVGAKFGRGSWRG